MLLQAFLVGLAAAIGQSDYLLGTAMVERPIVLGAIVGIFWVIFRLALLLVSSSNSRSWGSGRLVLPCHPT